MSPLDPAADRWSEARNVLCVRLDTIGDVIMTTPAIRALKESVPGRRITLLTSSRAAEVAALIPELDGYITYDAPWMKGTGRREDSDPDLEMLRRLREARFDAAVIFTVYSQSPLPGALLCHLADIPQRLAHCRENPYQLLTQWVPEPEPQQVVRHEVQRQLDLVAAVGARASSDRLSLRPPPAARRRAAALLRELDVDARRPWVVIHPGASAESRRYPPEGFAAAARTLVKEHGWQVLLTGTESEGGLVDGIRRAMGVPAHSLAGKLALSELAALVSLAPLVISNNTAPVHIASALSTPVVDLYALTNPQHTPWRVPNRTLFHDVPCRYCYKSVCPEGHHNCLRLVPPEAVVQAALELVTESGTGRALDMAAHLSAVRRRQAPSTASSPATTAKGANRRTGA